MTAARDKIDEVLVLLCTRFPKAFFLYERQRRPLKIGIHRDINAVLDEQIHPKTLHRALRANFVNAGYLKSRRAGAARIELEGKVAGVVTEEE
jgi:ProP effector